MNSLISTSPVAIVKIILENVVSVNDALHYYDQLVASTDMTHPLFRNSAVFLLKFVKHGRFLSCSTPDEYKNLIIKVNLILLKAS